MQSEHWVPAFKLEEVEAAIEKLSKKSVKLGGSPITVTWTGRVEARKRIRTMEGGYIYRKATPSDLQDPLAAFLAFHEAIVEGEPPKLAGWRFVATLEHTPDGNVIRGMEDVDPYWRTADPWCEHCKSKRHRKDTYLVQHEDGNVVQVGRNCLRDFLGHKDPERVAALAAALWSYIGSLNDEPRWGGHVWPSAERYVGWVVRQVRVDGYYRSRARAAETGQFSTRDKAEYLMGRHLEAIGDGYDVPEDERPSDADYERARTMLAWAADGEGPPPSEQFLWNLYLAARGGVADPRHRGLLAAVIPAYAKAHLLDDIATACGGERKVRVVCDEYVGEIKQRLDLTLHVERVMNFGPTGYGHGDEDRLLVKMRDEAGHLFTWWTNSGTYYLQASGGDSEYEHVVLTGRGTVKAHDEYRGEKQTVLTRCQFTRVEEAAV